MLKRSCTILIILLLTGCGTHSSFTGFWEGPHPEDVDKHFYFGILEDADSLQVRGYWTDKGHYASSFDIDSLIVHDDSISLFIPGWGCRYEGRLEDKDHITGYFFCDGEPEDPVDLARNDPMADRLIYPVPGSRNPDLTYCYDAPKDPENGLAVGPYKNVGDSLFIHTLLNEILAGTYDRVNAFLVYRHGSLICEEYFYGYTSGDTHPIESCTKSVTSLLIGIARNKGYIQDLDEPLYAIFPDKPYLKNPGYREITLRHVLTMSSGFDPQTDELYRSDRRLDFALKRPLIYATGETFQYDGGNTEILGAVIKKTTGLFADDFARTYLFDPLGIDNYNWDLFKQDGYPMMGGSLHLRPRDMIKIGTLVLNSGRHNNRQIVSSEWISMSTSPKIPTHMPDYDYAYQLVGPDPSFRRQRLYRGLGQRLGRPIHLYCSRTGRRDRYNGLQLRERFLDHLSRDRKTPVHAG